MFVIWSSEQTVKISLRVINLLVFITEIESVYWAVGSTSLYNSQIILNPRRVKNILFCPSVVRLARSTLSERS